MSCYIITYDLKEPSTAEDYEKLYKAIKSYGIWAHVTESCWAIVSDQKATEVRDYLAGQIRENDRLFIIKSASVGAWRNVICRSEWLKERL